MGKKNSKERKITAPSPDLESYFSDESLAKNGVEESDTPLRVHIHSRRKRLADADGVSGKAAIDGLVEAKVLKDDSAQYIEEVTFSQEKIGPGEEEETIIELYRYEEM